MVYKAIKFYSLIFGLFLAPGIINAGYIELQYTVLSSETGSSTIELVPGALQVQNDEIVGNTVSFAYPSVTSEYDTQITGLNASKCSTVSGSGGLSGLTIFNLSDTFQTSPPGYLDCSTTGVYYLLLSTRNSTELPTGNNFEDCTSKDCFYIKYFYDSQNNRFYKSGLYGEIGETSVTYTQNTRFTGLSITGTSTISIAVGYYLDSTEIDENIPALYPQLIRYSTSLIPSTVFSSVSENISPYTLDTISTTTTEYTGLLDGTYDLNVTFYNNSSAFTGVIPFSSNFIYSSFTIASGTLVAVGNTEIYGATQSTTPRYLDCNLNNITNCFINALVYVFLPSDTTLNRFLSLKTELATVIPFGYFVYVYDTLNTIELDGTAPLIPVLPFQEAIFTPLRNGTGYILWLLFAFFLYRRFKNIEY